MLRQGDADRRGEWQPLTVIMYHYVRPLNRSRFPRIRGLELELFLEQLQYICRHYDVVTVESVLHALVNDARLPRNAALLTFDDGLSDHFRHVIPPLLELGIQGAFFPVTSAVSDRKILDVHAIHFILASVADCDQLVRAVEGKIAESRDAFRIPSLEELRSLYWKESRLDPAPVIYVKRLLQHALPVVFREELVDHLFRTFVSNDPQGFADELYLDVDQLSKMLDMGMHVGGHGATHRWMGHLSREEQAAEIDGSLNLLGHLGISQEQVTFCFPYGDYNRDSLELLRSRRCGMAFTTRVDVADLRTNQPLEIPRLDTNDLPKVGAAMPNEWTRMVSG